MVNKFLKNRNEFNAKQVGLKHIEELEEIKNENTTTKRVKVISGIHVPVMLASLIGVDEISYEDVKTLDHKTGVITYYEVPPVLKETVLITGQMEVKEIDEHSCKHITTINVEVKCWGGK
jgi:hypothetical protein